MTSIELRYDVPVYVTVDLDTDTVTSIVVDDEAVSLNMSIETLDSDARAAIGIAEVADWPEWQIGN